VLSNATDARATTSADPARAKAEPLEVIAQSFCWASNTAASAARPRATRESDVVTRDDKSLKENCIGRPGPVHFGNFFRGPARARAPLRRTT